MVMRERSSALDDVTFSTPSMPATWFSMIWVIFVFDDRRRRASIARLDADDRLR